MFDILLQLMINFFDFVTQRIVSVKKGNSFKRYIDYVSGDI